MEEQLLLSLLFLSSQGLACHLLFQKIPATEISSDGYFFGSSSKMARVKELVDRLAPSPLTLLIQGPSGSGKEGIARYIAKKAKKKIITVNCAAIPANLAESILFGHKKGSFTGATQDQTGKFEEAHQGILFLDEIGDLNLEIQAKILRAIQDKVVQPLGGKEKQIDVRILAATHKNLDEQVALKLFREDLFYRLSEAVINLPGLHDRPEDISLLVQTFTKEFCERNNLAEKLYDPEALEFFKTKIYPGNIRELKSLVHRACVLIDGVHVTREMLELVLSTSKSTYSAATNLYDAKKNFVSNHIRQVLETAGGNKTKAAEMLRISTRNLFRLISDQDEDDRDHDSSVRETGIPS